MKKYLFLLLSLIMVISVAACGTPAEDADPVVTASPTPPDDSTPPPTPPSGGDTPDVFLWDDFTDRDPQNKPDTAPNGAPIWWDNWANLRASVDGGVAQLQFRPRDFDPEDFDDMDDYYARAMDWMGNWGEAIDMWSLDDISYCKYLTIRMAGADGGEENKLLLHFQPEDGPTFFARFSDLVTKDGDNVVITTEMQDIVIDLQASGFPGMTNRMHIRAFYECTIFIDEIYFSEPTGLIDSSSQDSILGGFTVNAIDWATIAIRDFVAAASGTVLWENFTDRDPQSKPDLAAIGVPMWWDNWANLRADVEDGIATIEFRPRAFDAEDFDDMDDYYARAMDWMGNWGQAVDVWAVEGISWTKYLTFRMAGLEGGEEDMLLLHFQPEDGPVFIKRFSDLVTADGDNVAITTDMQDIVIDLEASGFPGMTNRMHVRAFAGCTILIDEIYFHGAVSPIDTDNVVGSITIPEIQLPDIAELVASLG